MRGKLTPLAIAVLELLQEKPMHPYEMAQLMRERRVDNRVKIKAGSLYHTVDRLHDAGLVEVVGTGREGRRPERTVYAMTGAGRDEFLEQGKELLGNVAPEYPRYLSGLAILDELPRATVAGELENRVLALEAKLAGFEVVTARLLERGLPEIYWVDWRYRVAHCRFELEWTRELLKEITSGRLRWEHPDRATVHLTPSGGHTTAQSKHKAG